MLFRTPNSIGRVAADREAGADYAGHTESGGCSNKLVLPPITKFSAKLDLGALGALYDGNTST